VVTSLMKKNHPDNAQFFMEQLGKMYINGVNMKPLSMFPECQLPVPRNTPMISPMITKAWRHDEKYRIPHVDDIHLTGDSYDFDLTENGDADWLNGHVLNGIKLFPGTGYLCIAWQAMANKHDTKFEKLPVVFENVHIIRATMLPHDGKLSFKCRILENGNFEVTEGGGVAARGKISLASDMPKTLNEMKILDDKIKALPNKKAPKIPKSKEEIYLSLVGKGLDYSGPFRGVISTDRKNAEIKYLGQWISFLDCHLQACAYMFATDSRNAPSKFDTIYLDATKIEAELKAGAEEPVTKLTYDEEMDYLTSDVMKIKHIQFINTAFKPSGDPIYDETRFVPYTAITKLPNADCLREYATDCLQYAIKGIETALDSGKFPALTKNKKLITDSLKDFKNKKTSSTDLDLVKSCQLPNSALAKTLKKLLPTGTTADPMTVEEVVTAAKTDLAQDCLIDSLGTEETLRGALQIVKYNNPEAQANTIVELDAASSRLYRHIHPYLLVRAGITYHGLDAGRLPKDFKGQGYKGVQWDLNNTAPEPDVNAELLVLKNVLHKQADIDATMKRLMPLVNPGGFVLVQEITHNFPLFAALEGLNHDLVIPDAKEPREFGRYFTDSTLQSAFARLGLDLVFRKSDNLLSTMYLLRKKFDVPLEPTFIRMGDVQDYSWFKEAQKEMIKIESEPKESGKRLWLVSDTYNCGVVGMVQTLRKEPGGEKVRLVLNTELDSTVQKADLSIEHLKKTVVPLDLYQNVFRGGQYGFFSTKNLDATYVKENATCEDAYVTVPTVGDPASAHWSSSRKAVLAIDDSMDSDKDKFANVYYTAVNDRDVAYANGEIPRSADTLWRYRHGLYGFEFAGKRDDGSRVMGLVPGLALSTGLNTKRGVVLDVPADWSMKDAATVPYCYMSVYYALVVKSSLTQGQSILVHAGATPMGTAAIRTALNRGAVVYTSVFSEEERRLVKQTFPQLPESHIVLRKDELTVEETVQKLTSCQGVNMVLSPYADASLYEESVFALADSGLYIEMGRATVDPTVEEFSLKLMQKGMRYVRVDAMAILNDKSSHSSLSKCMTEDMKKGLIKPLTATIYEAKDISQAFSAATSKNITEKVVVQVREESSALTKKVELPVHPHVTCDPKKVYVLVGGMGGFGLELAHWLVQRGARNIMFTSRRGVTTGYQEHKIAILRENYKANIEVLVNSNRSQADANAMLKHAQKTGPIGGIFIMSLVLRDIYFTEMTPEAWNEAANTKINDVLFLDTASRELCGPELDWFVPFSSVASCWGIASQTNYSFGNSVMERTTEKRKQDGLAGLTIQWGPIGDVGAFLVKEGSERMHQTMVETFRSIGLGTQRIDSAVNAFDTLLLLTKEAVVYSYQPISFQKSKTDGDKKTSLLEATRKVFGLNSLDNITDDVTLMALGLDSLMGVEMKQLLEKDYDVNVTLNDVRKMTFGRLREIEADNSDE